MILIEISFICELIYNIFNFTQVVLSILCDVERDYELHITISDISEYLLNHVDASHPANLYRKVSG